jgi:predicted porin
MQKKIIALAVAGLMSGAAFAQTNVTVYGVVDQYYAHGNADQVAGTPDQSFNGLNSGGLSGSRLGFKGVEDLGNGLKAAFVFEYGTLDSTANSATNTVGVGRSQVTNGMDNWRQAYVGLVGNFGTAVAGRLQHFGYDWAAKYDTNGASIFSPMGQLSDNAGLATSARDALGRTDNAIAYISPNLSGFTVKGAYAFGEQIDGSRQISAAGAQAAVGSEIKSAQDIWQLAADYDNGPVAVGFVYTDVSDLGGTARLGVSTDRTEWALGGSYDFGMAKLFGTYQKAKTDVSGAGADTDYKLWHIGARAPIGANMSVALSYGEINVDPSNANDEQSDVWSLDFQYNLSKRTTAYAGYTKLSNDNGINYSLLNLKGSATGQTATAGLGQSSDQFVVGLRHTF